MTYSKPKITNAVEATEVIRDDHSLLKIIVGWSQLIHIG